MRSPLGGSIATCLIFVPLVAVPLLAVLGMPQLSVNASNAPVDDLKFVKDSSARTVGNADLFDPVQVTDPHSDVAASNRETRDGARGNDPFAEFVRDSDSSRQDATSAGSRGSAAKRPQRWPNEGNGLPQRALLSADRTDGDRATASPSDRPPAGRSQEGNRTDQPTSEPAKSPGARRALPEAEAVVTSESNSAATTPPAEAPAGPRTNSESRSASNHATAWKRAVGRLNALGIHDYQLQPGERSGEFNFSCRFAARGNPRVIHRFEAEAADPLDAINQVLRQLDDWRSRHTDRRQAVREPESDQNATPRVADPSEVEVTNRAF
jgi:hypothetical protein